MTVRHLITALLVFFGLSFSVVVRAHEIQPAVADIAVGKEDVALEISFNSEVLLAGIDASLVNDTNFTAEANIYDGLRSLGAEAITQKIFAHERLLLATVQLRNNDTPLAVKLDEVIVLPQPDLSLPRLTRVRISGALSNAQDGVTFQAKPEFGPVVLRQVSGIGAKAGAGSEASDAMLYTAYLLPGDISAPIFAADALRLDGQSPSMLAVFGNYIRIGIVHIIPKGLDHIAFIAGLFFFSPRWRPLIAQVTIFTLAHSITLALASLGIVKVPAGIVEPLIALSIAWIGVENILRPRIMGSGSQRVQPKQGRLGAFRLGVIFGFGLLHGLGFAFVLAETGFSGGSLAINMLAFNIGVELGQIMVLAPLVLAALWLGRFSWYQSRLASPASALIAAVGLFWFVERITAG
jgi:hypothetical protein